MNTKSVCNKLVTVVFFLHPYLYLELGTYLGNMHILSVRLLSLFHRNHRADVFDSRKNVCRQKNRVIYRVEGLERVNVNNVNKVKIWP